MEDIRDNRLSYMHDNSSSSTDGFEVSALDTRGLLDGPVPESSVAVVRVEVRPKQIVPTKPSLLEPPLVNKGLAFLERRRDGQVLSSSQHASLICPFKRKIQLLYFLLLVHVGHFQLEDFFLLFGSYYHEFS